MAAHKDAGRVLSTLSSSPAWYEAPRRLQRPPTAFIDKKGLPPFLPTEKAA